MALATLAQLKTQLGFKPSDTVQDPKLQLFLDAGSAWVESYCNRIFSQASRTELFHGNRSNALNPRQWPITAVTELRVSSTRSWGDSSSLLDSSSYGISPDGIMVINYSGIFPLGFDNVRLIYTAGYATIPADLVLANLWASEWFYLHNNRGDAGRTSVSKQGESIGIDHDIPPMIKSILQPYKRIELASDALAVRHV
jgi:hypothetical protein